MGWFAPETPEEAIMNAREKRKKMLRDFILERIPNILKVDSTYSIKYDKPFRINTKGYNCDKYYLEIRIIHNEVLFGYRKDTIENIRSKYGYNDEHTYKVSFNSFYWDESILLEFQPYIDKQICEFLQYANKYVNDQIEYMQHIKTLEIAKAVDSVARTEQIINKWLCPNKK